jgi:hypothetical protein
MSGVLVIGNLFSLGFERQPQIIYLSLRILIINKIAPLILLFKGRGFGEGLRKYRNEIVRCREIRQNLLFLQTKVL